MRRRRNTTARRTCSYSSGAKPGSEIPDKHKRTTLLRATVHNSAAVAPCLLRHEARLYSEEVGDQDSLVTKIQVESFSRMVPPSLQNGAATTLRLILGPEVAESIVVI
ncbi:hypothetical protein PG997_014595 [Apiospora hydei]|uniref:Uncharacterized protein n=1 Tax=Apiospora hydei TaxID=1337664 RepID=A0ABR1UU91_9PEZI